MSAAFALFSVSWFVFAYALADRLPASTAGWLSTGLYSGWSFVVATAALVTVVRRGVFLWLPLAVGLVALVTGDLLWDLSAHGLIAVPNRSPSLMDGLYLPAYAALGVTAFLLVRRYHSRDAGAVLDTVVVIGGVVAGVLPLVLRPYVDAISTGTPLARVVSIAYPVCDLLLVAAIAVCAFSWLKVRPLRLLGAAAACALVADHVYLEQTQAGTYRATGSWVDWLWLAEYTCLSAALMSPLPERPERIAATPLRARAAMLVGSALLSPLVLLAVQFGLVAGSRGVDVGIALSTVVIVALVCLRLTHLLVENARAVDRLRLALADAERLTTDLDHQARHDAVTGLPNRRHLAERLRRLRFPPAHALVSIDLDDFTALNDDLGHAVGDLVLREVAARLRATVGPADLVARLGGDEFAVLLRVQDETAALRISRALVRAVSAPVPVAGRSVVLSASAGVALVGGPAEGALVEADGLIRADLAMYAAKRAGRNRVVPYRPQLRADLLGGPELARELVRAVREGTLDVVYQPVVSLVPMPAQPAVRPSPPTRSAHSGHSAWDAPHPVVGVEALVRWDHPRLGQLPPPRFLPLAVERGVVADLDLLVLERSLDDARRWREQRPDLRVAVNASAELLARRDAVDVVLHMLARHDFPGHLLTVEVTEQSVIDDPVGAAGRLQRLREAGVRVALDDFGTGYASLSYLADLPVDVLKLDRSFVARGVSGAGASRLLRGVVELGHELGLQVLAEGIETAGQAAALAAVGCDLGQGWFFASARAAGDLLVGDHSPRLDLRVPTLDEQRFRSGPSSGTSGRAEGGTGGSTPHAVDDDQLPRRRQPADPLGIERAEA